MVGDQTLVAFIATADPEQARSFYSETLGLRLVSEDEFALVFDANGTMLRLQKVESVSPAPYTSLGWNVSDIEATMERLSKPASGLRSSRSRARTVSGLPLEVAASPGSRTQTVTCSRSRSSTSRGQAKGRPFGRPFLIREIPAKSTGPLLRFCPRPVLRGARMSSGTGWHRFRRARATPRASPSQRSGRGRGPRCVSPRGSSTDGGR
jgi:Glyoxalase/Bleomycin resistance protein/Dioxygenase superfamily